MKSNRFFMQLITCLFIFSKNIVATNEELPLFEKTQRAVLENQLEKSNLDGIDAAERLACIAKKYPNHHTQTKELSVLANECLEHFPNAPSSFVVPETMTWQEYKQFMIGLAEWKSTLDSTCNHSSRSLDLEYTGDYSHVHEKVYHGFIPTPTGHLGKAVILLCLAHHIAPLRFPLNFNNIKEDSAATDTKGFILHDYLHIQLVYGKKDMKHDFIFDGGFYKLPEIIPFNDGLIEYFFDGIWENTKLPLSYSSNMIPYWGDLYELTYGKNPYSSKEELNLIIHFLQCIVIVYHL